MKQASMKLVCDLPPIGVNGRNSEGDFLRAPNGDILFAYSRYNTTDGGDHCPCDIALMRSSDEGETWSDSMSIIGRTLEEERALGHGDLDCKYGKYSCSYANSFYERISDDEVLVLYNDLCYPDENGVNTKAGFVRRIKLVENLTF